MLKISSSYAKPSYSDGEMSPNNQGKDTTTGPSESLAKEVSVCTVGGGLLLERLRSEITPSLSLSLGKL